MASKETAQDGLVMATNNSSIVSKRSVERLYYPEPHFVRHFVRRPQRRSPLINRGYWLRMRVIEHKVLQFLQRKGSHPRTKVVINLGCGYDPLPFQLLAKRSAECQTAVFVDVDYDALMQNKRDVILRTPQLCGLLPEIYASSNHKAVLLRSPRYMAVGCDLTETARLEAAIKSEIVLDYCDLLFIAEVSLTYMETSAANAVISWASKLSNSVRFCLMEQFLPGGAGHPFATTMLKHFEKLQAPLRSILQYPTLEKQVQRFVKCGWKIADIKSLWEFWQSSIVSSPVRRQLDSVEPFDEWEEFALFASHYFILEARSGLQSESGMNEVHHSEMRKEVDGQSISMPPIPKPPTSLRLTYFEPSKMKNHRRYGAAWNQDDSVICYHGGHGPQSRLQSTDIYGFPRESPFEALVPPSKVSARMFHTVTSLGPKVSLLVGGRSSPDKAMADCWLRLEGLWSQHSDIPVARYRHCATRVRSNGVLVHGGKHNASNVLGDWLLWEETVGWQYPSLKGRDGILPPPSFSASLVSHEDGQGYLFGGIGEEGCVLNDIWSWKLDRCDARCFLEFEKITNLGRYNGAHYNSLDERAIDRFGAVALPTNDGLTIVGGISTYGAHQIQDEVVQIQFQNATDGVNKKAPFESPQTGAAYATEDNTAWESQTTEETTGERLNGFPTEQTGSHGYEKLVISFKRSTDYQDSVRPLLVGHAAVAVDAQRVVILGGGAVCFSFGTHWNEGTWILQENTATVGRTPWELLVANQENEGLEEANPGIQRSFVQVQGSSSPSAVDRFRVHSASKFNELVTKSKPAILEDLEVGPCTTRWTLKYLRSKIGSDRLVVVHEAKSKDMNFQSKNFEYVKKKFGDFLDEIAAGEKQYLRSISNDRPGETPANLVQDFPEISEDFKLPSELAMVISSAHSSPLRVSGPVTMWLHYDVMANVLCQIKGTKRVILYPPSDISALSFPAGASSSTINVFENGPIIESTHPVEAQLKPGDVLFIPPLWSHTAAPTETVSIAVNVFFRNLAKGYAAGRDVYGNRDLAAYENGRRDIDRLVKNFKDLPKDMARFYVERLANELKDKASAAGSS